MPAVHGHGSPYCWNVHYADPSREARGALARAALDNTDRLLTDASTRLAAGSATSAHSLAVLALEEVGKAIICFGGFGGPENTVTTAGAGLQRDWE